MESPIRFGSVRFQCGPVPVRAVRFLVPVPPVPVQTGAGSGLPVRTAALLIISGAAGAPSPCCVDALSPYQAVLVIPFLEWRLQRFYRGCEWNFNGCTARTPRHHVERNK